MKTSLNFVMIMLCAACGSYSGGGGSSTNDYVLTETTTTGAVTSVTLSFVVSSPSAPTITIAQLEAALVDAVSSVFCGGNTTFNYYSPTNVSVDISNSTGSAVVTTRLAMPTATGCTLNLTEPASDAGWSFENSSGTETYAFDFTNT